MAACVYIYDRAAIEAALANRPVLASRVLETLVADAPASFPSARHSSLQIARVLSATNSYPHTALVIDDVERCLGAGLRARWLQTSSREQFRSGLAEARVACEFLYQGFSVEDVDTIKGADRVPEFFARSGEMELAIEVYLPRDWSRLADLTDALRERLLHLDLPYDYVFDLRVGLQSRFDASGGLASHHPGPVDAALDDAILQAALRAIVVPLVENIESGDPRGSSTYAVPSLNLQIEADLTSIRPAGGRIPDRVGSIAPWPAGGYAPEGMMDRLARRRMRRKLERGQAADAGARTSALIVDLSQCAIATEWDVTYYRQAFEQSLKTHVGGEFRGHDAVALVDTGGVDRRPRLLWSAHSPGSPPQLREVLALFGGSHEHRRGNR